ncbi:MAG: hypothetical protein ACF8LL_03230 [Phycisphaerales bacterium]
MSTKQRTLIAQLALALLGIAMIVIGAMGPMAPPIITGVGFFVIAWWMGQAPRTSGP